MYAFAKFILLGLFSVLHIHKNKASFFSSALLFFVLLSIPHLLWTISFSFSLSLCVSVSLSLCLSVSLFLLYISPFRTLYLSLTNFCIFRNNVGRSRDVINLNNNHILDLHLRTRVADPGSSYYAGNLIQFF